ncbi:MAG TPA: AAA family ATPase [Candidatus Binatia bacterium]|nr:AAA family ATPase [Candidatus Binatia bacterium]
MQTAYLKPFGLSEPAFDPSFNPHFFYANRGFQEAFLALRFGIKLRNGVIVLTGERGVGKTTLIRMVKERCELSTHLHVLSISDQQQSALLPRLMRALGLQQSAPVRHVLVQELRGYLLQQFQQDRTIAVVVEDAQKLDLQAFRDLESLSKLQLNNKNLLQIVLVGTPELKTTLQDPLLESFKQRVALWCRLEPLPTSEVVSYIHHRLTRAGQPKVGLFHPAAIDRIAERSRGVPALINAICERALLAAYSNKSDHVTAEIVERVWQTWQSSEAMDAQMSPRSASFAAHPRSVEKRTAIVTGGSKFYSPPQTEDFALEDRMSGSERRRERWLRRNLVWLNSLRSSSQPIAFFWPLSLTRGVRCKQIMAQLRVSGERLRQSIVPHLRMFRQRGRTWSNSPWFGWSAVIVVLFMGGSIPMLLGGAGQDPEPYESGAMQEEAAIWQNVTAPEQAESPFPETPDVPPRAEVPEQLMSAPEIAAIDQGVVPQEVRQQPGRRENGSSRTVSFPEKVKTALNDKSQPVVYVHTSRQSDGPLIEEIGEVLRIDGYNVRDTRFTRNGTQGDVRFFFPRDREDAERVKSLVQSELGKRGYSLSLQLLQRDGKKFQNAAPGKIEVWLPPLAQAERGGRS